MQLQICWSQTAWWLVYGNVQELLCELHAGTTIIIIVAEPHDDFMGRLEDVSHHLDLRISLSSALLAHTDPVDPESDYSVGMAEAVQGFP